MKCLLCTVLIIVITTACSQYSQWTSVESDVAVNSAENRHMQCSNDSVCPTWFICDAEENVCKCGDGHDYAVVCDNERLISAVLDCYCVTYDQDRQTTYLGSCFYNCVHYSVVNKHNVIYTYQILLINNSVCTNFHRTGLLCGDCEDGHSPLVLSYNLSCVKCPDGHKNWWKFILVAFVPLTFFYFFVVVFNINVTSSRLHGVVWFSQALSMPALVRLVLNSTNIGTPNFTILLKVLFVFYSFWNLDILRSVMPDVCLNVTTLQALALDYLLALYPFFLILATYILIELYDRKCICIVAAWKPFHKVLTWLKKSWNIRTSVIDSFATFIFLSYVKFISVSFDILLPTRIYQLGSNKPSLRLFYTPSVEYFGNDHLPYAILAITLLTVFVIIPTVALFFYPFQFFQKFLSLFPFNWHFLRAFVDSYQGCYKDGTEPGTIDCRWLSTIVLIIRPILFLIYASTLSITFYVYATIILVIFAILLINFQPFKMKASSRYPLTDIVFYLLLGLCSVVLLGKEIQTAADNQVLTVIHTLSFAFIPNAVTIGLICSWFGSRIRWIKLFV